MEYSHQDGQWYPLCAGMFWKVTGKKVSRSAARATQTMGGVQANIGRADHITAESCTVINLLRVCMYAG